MKPGISVAKTGLLTFLMAVTLLACKKDTIEPEPIPDHDKKYINVVLHPYLQPSEVDSAIAKWRVGGVEKVVKLALRTDSLYADVQSFASGAGTLTVQIYSNKKLAQKSLQYGRAVNLNLQHTHNVRINGPENFQDQNWKPRIIFKLRESNHLHITAIVAIRPEDPYFEFQKIDPAWRHRILLERVYYKLGPPHSVIAEGGWDCTNNCPGGSGDYINTTHFQFLAQQANNRSWDRVEFLLRFYSAPNNAAETNFDYNF